MNNKKFPAIELATKRLREKIAALKDSPAPKIFSVSFNRATGEPYLKCYGAKNIEEFHKKYDPELRDFLEATSRPRH